MSVDLKIKQLFPGLQNVTIIRGRRGQSLYQIGYWYVFYDGCSWNGTYTGRKALKFKTYGEAQAYKLFLRYQGCYTARADRIRSDLVLRYTRMLKTDEYGNVSLKTEALSCP